MQVNIDMASETGNHTDNLQLINGVGPAYAKALNAIGIRRFADMTHYQTPAELQQVLLEKTGVDVPVWKIENSDWLGQARTLADKAERAEYRREARTDATPNADEWQRHAHFLVFFDHNTSDRTVRTWQTRTYHDETDVQEVFAGCNPDIWATWIMEQAGFSEIASSEEPELMFLAPPVDDIAIVSIDSVSVSEYKPDFGSIKGEMKVKVNFKMRKSSLVQEKLTHLSYRLEIHLVDLEHNSGELVASTLQTLQVQHTEFYDELMFPYPTPGRYKLYTVVFVPPPITETAIYKGPVLNFVLQ